MQIDLKKIHSSLKKKWFRIEDDRDHYYCRFYRDGEGFTNIRSKVGGFSKEKYKALQDPIIKKITKTLFFDTKEQFVDFINCPFSREEYQELLEKKNKI